MRGELDAASASPSVRTCSESESRVFSGSSEMMRTVESAHPTAYR